MTSNVVIKYAQVLQFIIYTTYTFIDNLTYALLDKGIPCSHRCVVKEIWVYKEYYPNRNNYHLLGLP